MGIQFQTFPKSMSTPEIVRDAIQVFRSNEQLVDSHRQTDLKSNDVLAVLREELVQLRF